MKKVRNKISRIWLVTAWALAAMVVLMAACSSSDDKSVAGGTTEDAGIIADLNVAGVAQKGPFVEGSAVTMQGMDCKTLKFTDEVFEGEVKSDKGDFTVDSVILSASTCALFEVTGRYLNEVTGKKTKGELTLRALTDLKDRENVNVNLLTNLAYERMMYLVKEKSKTLAKAKVQAEKEVLAAFDIKDEVDEFENLNIFELGDGNAALLAVSVMMQGNTDAAGLAKRIERFEDSFAESGVWNDPETKKAIAEWTAEVAASGELETIRKNIEDMGYAGEVPAFEKYVPAVEPADSTEESSSSVEQDSVEKVDSSSSNKDSRDSTVASSSSEEVNADTTSSSSVVPPVSSSSFRDSLETLISSSSSIPDSLDSLRSSSSFVPDSLLQDGLSSSSFIDSLGSSSSRSPYEWYWDVPKEYYLNPNVAYDSITDMRDGKVYKIVTIGDQVWMAENLNYADSAETPSLKGRSWCFDNDDKKCELTGRYYTWAAAMDSVALARDTVNPMICGYGVKCAADSMRVRGICPEGWHLPDTMEIKKLISTVGRTRVSGAMLKSSKGWSSASGVAEDAFGFSALAGGYVNGELPRGELKTYFIATDSYAKFWGSVSYDKYYGEALMLSSSNGDAVLSSPDKYDGNNVRCVKN